VGGRSHPLVAGVVAVGDVGDGPGGVQSLGVRDHRPADNMAVSSLRKNRPQNKWSGGSNTHIHI